MDIARLNAAVEGRYRIERELGRGGMATVYLAEDLKHQRHVAIKVLSPELAAVIGADRFLAEIRTTANLQHPHILPLHDSGEVNGTVFYVMPFVTGESLRDRLARERQLPIDDAIRIASEVGQALDYAHRAATRVEAQLLEWMKSLMGFPRVASGLVTSGGSVANILGVTVARDARLGAAVGESGVGAVPGKPRLYASREVHSSVMKVARMLGLGREAVRLIDVDESYRVRVDSMPPQIERDRAAGDRPFLVIGTAGTINTGSVDDLNALADLSAEFGL